MFHTAVAVAAGSLLTGISFQFSFTKASSLAKFSFKLKNYLSTMLQDFLHVLILRACYGITTQVLFLDFVGSECSKSLDEAIIGLLIHSTKNSSLNFHKYFQSNKNRFQL